MAILSKSGRIVAGTAAAGVACATAVTAKPPPSGFWLVGMPEGATGSSVKVLSQDGLVAGGNSYIPAISTSAGFRWTAATGRDDWGLLPGMPTYTPVSASDSTGQIVAGYTLVQGPPNPVPYRRVGNSLLEKLGAVANHERNYAWGMSGDGNVVVGHGESGPQTGVFGQAFRWTPTKGMQGLGYLNVSDSISKANGVSRDGVTIVGTSSGSGVGGAFVWTEAAGMKALPWLDKQGGIARAANADGSVIVGEVPSVAGLTHAARWVNGQIEDLGLGLPMAVNDDGSVVAGTYGEKGIVWTAELGIVQAIDYLAMHGVTVPAGYQLQYVYAISGDGRTFGGYGKNLLTGKFEGFVAAVPDATCLADCDASGELDIDDFICFQTRFAISDPYADCDASGELDIDDFICFQTLFAIGC